MPPSGYQTNGSWTSHAFYHADGGGNVTFLSPSTYSGTMTRYSYDAYGRTTSLNGPLATANVYRFSSKELHAASGHYYYGYRFYDPQAQRWINRDPLGEAGGMNLYGFVGNGPVGAVDSSGLHGNVISSTLPGMAGTWTSNPYGAGSPGTLPGDFFVPMPPAWTTPSELADVEDQQVARVTESLESESILGNTALYLHANIRYGLHDMLRFGDGMAEGSLTGVGEDCTRMGGLILLLLGRPPGYAQKAVATATIAAAEVELGAELASLARKRHLPAVVVGAVDPRTGTAVAARSFRGYCAERAAADALGIPDKAVKFTRPVRPRNGQIVPVCKECQKRFDRLQFPDGTPFE